MWCFPHGAGVLVFVCVCVFHSYQARALIICAKTGASSSGFRRWLDDDNGGSMGLILYNQIRWADAGVFAHMAGDRPALAWQCAFAYCNDCVRDGRLDTYMRIICCSSVSSAGLSVCNVTGFMVLCVRFFACAQGTSKKSPQFGEFLLSRQHTPIRKYCLKLWIAFGKRDYILMNNA